jgi:hypothetical protein
LPTQINSIMCTVVLFGDEDCANGVGPGNIFWTWNNVFAQG